MAYRTIKLAAQNARLKEEEETKAKWEKIPLSELVKLSATHALNHYISRRRWQISNGLRNS